MPELRPRAPRLAAAALVLALAGLGAVAQEGADAAAAGREQVIHPEAEDAARQIRCDCGCPPQSAFECACGHAAGMRASMDAEARAGKTGKEIVAGYLEREGPGIVMAPPMKGWNLTAWFGPTVAILIGIPVLIAILRRLRRSAIETAAAEAAPAGDDPYRERVLREFEGFDREGTV